MKYSVTTLLTEPNETHAAYKLKVIYVTQNATQWMSSLILLGEVFCKREFKMLSEDNPFQYKIAKVNVRFSEPW